MKAIVWILVMPHIENEALTNSILPKINAKLTFVELD